MFKYIIQLIKLDKKKKIFFFLLFIFVSSILESFTIAILLPILTIIFNGKNILLDNLFVKKIEYLIIYLNNFSEREIIIHSLIFLIIIFFIKNLFLIYFSWYKETYNTSLKNDLATKLFKSHLQNRYQNFYRNNSADYTSMILNQSPIVADGLTSFLFLLNEAFIFIIIFLFLSFFESAAAFLGLLILILFSIPLYLYTKKNLSIYSASHIKHDQKQIKNLNEGFLMFKFIKIHKLENFFVNYFSDNNKKYNQAVKFIVFISSLPRFIYEFFIMLFVAIVSLILVLKNYNLSSFIPLLGVFLIIILRLVPSFSKILNSIQKIKTAIPSLNSIKRYLHDSNKKLSKTRDYINFESIRLNNILINFNRQNILKKINLEINKGDKILIEGESGTGKTTLINVIIGLINFNAGKIFVNKKNFRGKEVFNFIKFGYVPQLNFLIDGSIEDNIMLEKNCEKNIFKKVVKICLLENFIASLPNKEKSNIGENGFKISGGQKQKICIARVLLETPDVLILDEATNAVDTKSEDRKSVV
jgi:ABC-type multidrug transport system fused ATPase/permease subunit